MIGVAQGLGVNGAIVTGGSMKVAGKPPIAEVTSGRPAPRPANLR